MYERRGRSAIVGKSKIMVLSREGDSVCSIRIKGKGPLSWCCVRMERQRCKRGRKQGRMESKNGGKCKSFARKNKGKDIQINRAELLVFNKRQFQHRPFPDTAFSNVSVPYFDSLQHYSVKDSIPVILNIDSLHH